MIQLFDYLFGVAFVVYFIGSGGLALSEVGYILSPPDLARSRAALIRECSMYALVSVPLLMWTTLDAVLRKQITLELLGAAVTTAMFTFFAITAAVLFRRSLTIRVWSVS